MSPRSRWTSVTVGLAIALFVARGAHAQREAKLTANEFFRGFSLTKFNGEQITL